MYLQHVFVYVRTYKCMWVGVGLGRGGGFGVQEYMCARASVGVVCYNVCVIC